LLLGLLLRGYFFFVRFIYLIWSCDYQKFPKHYVLPCGLFFHLRTYDDVNDDVNDDDDEDLGESVFTTLFLCAELDEDVLDALFDFLFIGLCCSNTSLVASGAVKYIGMFFSTKALGKLKLQI
jgi:hypothetical protein